MATTTTKTKAKTTAAKKAPVKKTTAVAPEAKVEAKPDVLEAAPAPAVDQPRKFEMSDMVPCQSVRNGVLQYIGKKTGDIYEWSDYGDITDVAYGDLVSFNSNKF